MLHADRCLLQSFVESPLHVCGGCWSWAKLGGQLAQEQYSAKQKQVLDAVRDDECTWQEHMSEWLYDLAEGKMQHLTELLTRHAATSTPSAGMETLVQVRDSLTCPHRSDVYVDKQQA